jgi:hypothetical protein
LSRGDSRQTVRRLRKLDESDDTHFLSRPVPTPSQISSGAHRAAGWLRPSVGPEQAGEIPIARLTGNHELNPPSWHGGPARRMALGQLPAVLSGLPGPR